MPIDQIHTAELEALQALLDSDGWKVFTGVAGKLWGDTEGNGERFLQAISGASKAADADAMAQLRQIIVAQREIQILVKWPAERVKQLTQASQPGPSNQHQSRRGSL